MLSTILAINIQINHLISYKADPLDHWQSPKETLELLTGDCEDYAIVKYFALRKAGIKPEDMRLIYTTEQGGHVSLEVNGLILDNRTDELKPSSGKEIYSFNETWLYFDGKSYSNNLLPKWNGVIGIFRI